MHVYNESKSGEGNATPNSFLLNKIYLNQRNQVLQQQCDVSNNWIKNANHWY